MLRAKYQPNRPSGLEKKSFDWFSPYMGMSFNFFQERLFFIK